MDSLNAEPTAEPHITPALLTVIADGGLEGTPDIYRVPLGRLDGVYSDSAAYRAETDRVGADAEVYSVRSHSYADGPGSLTIGTSRLEPGKIGLEYALTRGHLHRRADRAELYYCLSGRGVMLMDTVDGRASAIELTPGKAVHVPGGWIHRSVNVGAEPFVTLFCYNSDSGQDYEIIADAGGMSQLVIDDGLGGWAAVPNPQHTGYRASTASE
ncbi:cupin domain-containing protein [Microbacterium sp. zg.B48]|uniref:glucose-6-phosphate isomerase family protein n=1 Tax=Microbacterium sp. zg.B48 TaxID=2969408 RepID=UPI00214CF76D|nr:glucose-6-phosphate isomerase family protein [Microbacterium sp. zg.B48]MCR2762814.1 cupin domain-containing protein [Microbacterium sp. zg.B48]